MLIGVPPPKEQKYNGSHLVDEWLKKYNPTTTNTAITDGAFIKAVRAATADVTAEEIADVTGRSLNFCYRIKIGQEPISLKLAEKLNEKLKLGVER